jgi:hypothetical protein
MKNDFNPVKEEKDGVKAKRMIWSTKVLNLALKGIEQGKKLVANPFYENNTKLIKGDLVFERTKEEIKEWLKCKNDIVYFAEKYAKLMTPEGIKHVNLRDYQKKYLKHLEQNRLSVYLACRQCGKCNSFISTVLVKISDIKKIISIKKDVYKLKKLWDKKYYIIKEDCYKLPLFELYNLYDNSFKWKIQYMLYKILYQYECRKIKKRTETRELEGEL